MKHHSSCMCDQAWDIPDVPCTCPKYWPRKSKTKKSIPPWQL